MYDAHPEELEDACSKPPFGVGLSSDPIALLSRWEDTQLMFNLTLHEPVAVTQGDMPPIGVYWLRIYETEDRYAAVVIVTEVPGNPGPSPTNAISRIRSVIMNQYRLGDAATRWFICYPPGLMTSAAEYIEVSFEPGVEWKGAVSCGEIEDRIGRPLDLVPEHEETLQRVLEVGGQLDRKVPIEFRVVPLDDVPLPNEPFRCTHYSRFTTFMRRRGILAGEGNRADRQAFYSTLTAEDYAACIRHQADWRLISDLAVEIVQELGAAPDSEQLAMAINSRVSPNLSPWLRSLFDAPLWWHDDQFTDGQHRACAIRASGAVRTVRGVWGSPLAPSPTWMMTGPA